MAAGTKVATENDGGGRAPRGHGIVGAALARGAVLARGAGAGGGALHLKKILLLMTTL